MKGTCESTAEREFLLLHNFADNLHKVADNGGRRPFNKKGRFLSPMRSCEEAHHSVIIASVFPHLAMQKANYK
jgi:hypothetical protein